MLAGVKCVSVSVSVHSTVGRASLPGQGFFFFFSIRTGKYLK